MSSAERATPTGSGWLVCLTLITFAIGTDDFIIAGVLPEIAQDHRVSEAAAGQLVTVFSITYALASTATDAQTTLQPPSQEIPNPPTPTDSLGLPANPR